MTSVKRRHSEESNAKRKSKKKTDSAKDASREAILKRLSTLDCGVKVQQSTIPNASLGLFATKDFAAGDPITAYYGEIIGHEEAQRRNRSHMRTIFSMRECIDGRFTHTGEAIEDVQKQLLGQGCASYANDARNSAANNAKFSHVDSDANKQALRNFLFGADVAQYTVGSLHKLLSPDQDKFQLRPEERTIYLTATKKIKAGEEIFVSYGRDYWKRHEEDV